MSRSAPRLVRTKTSARPGSRLEQLDQRVELGLTGDGDERVADVDACRAGLKLGLVVAGIGGVGAGQTADLAVQRGREEERLALLRQPAHDPVDLRLEAHVEHPVGLVKDEYPHRSDVDHPPLDQVPQPPGSRHQDRGRLGPLRLRSERRAAVDGADVEAARVRRSGQLLGHLGRELARRHQHECCRTSRLELSRSTSGIPKARVLPEPVGDCASTSRPASPSGMTRLWIANGTVIPRLARASTTGRDTPRPVNVSSSMNPPCRAAFRAASSVEISNPRRTGHGTKKRQISRGGEPFTTSCTAV